ncbi:MAG: thioesterase II family protein [Ruminiclostridium sp.]
MDKIQLFCIPYAGGSALIYSQWKKYLHESIELCPVELSGRGKRIGSPFYKSIYEAADDIYNNMKEVLSSNSSYALYGHSMGSLLVYELLYKLKSSGLCGPRHVFFSGSNPPHINKNKKTLHLLPEKEFIDEVLKLGGTPTDTFKNEEIAQVFVPILRADFKILETYNYFPKESKISCKVTALTGTDDATVLLHDVYSWKEYVESEFNVVEITGGHFFILDNAQKVVSIINNTLVSR